MTSALPSPAAPPSPPPALAGLLAAAEMRHGPVTVIHEGALTVFERALGTPAASPAGVRATPSPTTPDVVTMTALVGNRCVVRCYGRDGDGWRVLAD